MSLATDTSTKTSKSPINLSKLIGKNGENIIFPLLGFVAVIFIWSVVAQITVWDEENLGVLPNPIQTIQDSIPYLQNFFSTTQGDEGIFILVLLSLMRVAAGFVIATAIAIPLGFLVGTSDKAAKMIWPLVQVGKPISPLAWLPVGIVIFAGQNASAIFVIVITSLWSTLINTALGVRSIPKDYWNVAKVLNLSKWKVINKIMIPSTLPYIFTGMRLSLGIAWLVIVAAEMLTGGTGIGFFVWDVYNTGEISLVIFSLFIIGIVGLLLDQLVAFVERLVVGQDRM